MNRSTLNDTKLGDTNPRGRWRSPLLGRYARSMPSEREEKDQPLNFCRLRRQTALWYTLDKDQSTEREVRNCPPKRVRSRSLLWPGPPLGLYSVLGAAAMLAATTQGPISTVVLMFEMTGHNRAFIAPLLLAVTTATLVARLIEPRSIYDAKLSDEQVAARIAARAPASS